MGFFDVERSVATTSKGEVEMPLLYRDGSLVTLLWRVAPELARLVIPEDFDPMLLGGKALAVMCIFEYRDTTLGPYNELGVAVQVTRRGTRPSVLKYLADPRAQPEQALWVANLPVTTELAFAGGTELWGYPKYVTPIETDFSRDGFSGRLGDELEVTMGKGRGISMKSLPFVTFTRKDDRYIRTIIEANHQARFGGAATVELKVTGDGPTAKTARKLCLEGQKPWAAQRTDHLETILPLGVDAFGAARARQPVVA